MSIAGNCDRASCAATRYVVDLSERRRVRLFGSGLGVVVSGCDEDEVEGGAGDEDRDVVPMR
jgi:hypothetical protein